MAKSKWEIGQEVGFLSYHSLYKGTVLARHRNHGLVKVLEQASKGDYCDFRIGTVMHVNLNRTVDPSSSTFTKAVELLNQMEDIEEGRLLALKDKGSEFDRLVRHAVIF